MLPFGGISSNLKEKNRVCKIVIYLKLCYINTITL